MTISSSPSPEQEEEEGEEYATAAGSSTPCVGRSGAARYSSLAVAPAATRGSFLERGEEEGKVSKYSTGGGESVISTSVAALFFFFF